MITIIPLGLPEGGSVTYAGSPWMVMTFPTGVPPCKVPEEQSLHGMEAAIVEVLDGGVERDSRWDLVLGELKHENIQKAKHVEVEINSQLRLKLRSHEKQI